MPAPEVDAAKPAAARETRPKDIPGGKLSDPEPVPS
jgi:hypothetical protein